MEGRTGQTAITLIVAAGLLSAVTVQAAGSLSRLSGSNRLGTAIAVSQRLIIANDGAGAVLIARSDNFADALSASSLAGLLSAPILLTPPGQSLDAAVRSELDRVLPPGGTVIIAGGGAAVSASVDSELQGTYAVERLAGANRYETSRLIKVRGDQARGIESDTVIVASGTSFPDALAASSYAAFAGVPILLSKKEALPPETQSALSSSVNAAFVIGGPAALTQNVQDSVESVIGNLSQRIYGQDRYETAVATADFFFANPVAISLAVGANFPDALAGGVLAGKSVLSPFGMPILLTKTSTVPAVLDTYLRSHAGTIDDVTSGYVFGGTAAIDEVVKDALEKII